MKDVDYENLVVKSHAALSQSISNWGSELKKNSDNIQRLAVTQAVQTEILNEIKSKICDHEEKEAAVEKNVAELNNSDLEIKTSFKTFKWVGGIAAFVILGLIGTITGLATYAYTGDNDTQAEQVKSVKTAFDEHKAQNEKQFDEILGILRELKNKR